MFLSGQLFDQWTKKRKYMSNLISIRRVHSCGLNPFAHVINNLQPTHYAMIKLGVYVSSANLNGKDIYPTHLQTIPHTGLRNMEHRYPKSLLLKY